MPQKQTMTQKQLKVKEELDHLSEILKALQRRRRDRELQLAKYGNLDVPPYIQEEIVELTERIREREQEIAQLHTQFVEGELPLAEVEFRALVAEAWSASQGWLSAVDEARLELSRLRLGLPQDISDKHYDVVRQQLAIETLTDLDMNDIYKGDLEARSRAVQRIVCAFRFDPKITENTLRLNSESVDADVLAQWLSTTRIIWIHRDEYGKSKSLFEQLSRLSSKEQPPSVVARDIPQLWEGNYTYKDSLRSIPMVLERVQIFLPYFTEFFHFFLTFIHVRTFSVLSACFLTSPHHKLEHMS